MTTTSNTTTNQELTFEQLLAKATEVADARRKVAKDFLKFAKEVAIPKILEANQKLGFEYIEVWHDARLFENVSEAGDGEQAYKFSTRFWNSGEGFIVDSATNVHLYEGTSYSEFKDVDVSKALFYGMVKVLPLLVKELKRNVEKREKEKNQALSIMQELTTEAEAKEQA